MSDKNTSVQLKVSTRNRLEHAVHDKELSDYDACINWLLDNAGYLSWAEIQKLAKMKTEAHPGVPA